MFLQLDIPALYLSSKEFIFFSPTYQTRGTFGKDNSTREREFSDESNVSCQDSVNRFVLKNDFIFRTDIFTLDTPVMVEPVMAGVLIFEENTIDTIFHNLSKVTKRW